MSPMGMKPIQLEDEYSKKTGITPEDIAKLRLWLKTQPHLPEEHITDLDLILAFHCCNRSPELAKQVLDLNLTLRTLFTNYFENRKVDDQIERVFNDMAVLMTLDLCQSQDGTWPGLLIIVDFEGVTLGHLARLDLQNIQQFLYYVQEAILVRLKGMHFLNAPSFIDKVLLMMKPFLKKQLMDVLHIHTTGSTTVEKFVPIEALPKETGGKYKSYREIQDDVLENMRENKDFFKNESKKRVTEALRPGKPKTITDIFGGVEGSFKKLEID
ncbi:alpha-tocopherol transfer protein-like isoform X2 [Maniola jurtina]|uniref:alpha-tocopherol transfer protein-like isoform X2 n=1 Tax=Maniola jurtina TaxID=191418 RepID=UPI001E68918C|nr:alpha-tocopherol transfer protein-like isoform X2 [Maniola jurtina]